MIALRYGTVPLVRTTGGLKDSVFDTTGNTTGNGFRFDTYNAEDLYDALERALAAYADTDAWDALVQRAMASDNTWDRSANAYIRMYRALMKSE
jgi:starch synthase